MNQWQKCDTAEQEVHVNTACYSSTIRLPLAVCLTLPRCVTWRHLTPAWVGSAGVRHIHWVTLTWRVDHVTVVGTWPHNVTPAGVTVSWRRISPTVASTPPRAQPWYVHRTLICRNSQPYFYFIITEALLNLWNCQCTWALSTCLTKRINVDLSNLYTIHKKLRITWYFRTTWEVIWNLFWVVYTCTSLSSYSIPQTPKSTM